MVLILTLFSFSDGETPRFSPYAYLSLIRFVKVSSHVNGFNNRNKVMTAILTKGYLSVNLFQTFIADTPI